MKKQYVICLLVSLFFLNTYVSAENYVCIPTEINNNCASGNQHGKKIDYWEDDKTNYYRLKRLVQTWDKGNLVGSTRYSYHYNGKLQIKEITTYAVAIGIFGYSNVNGYKRFAEMSELSEWYDSGQIKLERKVKKEFNKEQSKIVSQSATNNRYLFNSSFTKREWYENGQMKSSQPYFDLIHCGQNYIRASEGKKCIENPKNGTYTWWYENGNLKREGNWRFGKLNGTYTEGFKNGQLKSLLFFNNDKYEGIQKDWHENGQLKIESNMKGGKRHGKRVEWDRNGQVVTQGQFEEGRCISESC